MHIWVDADACPAAAKEILYRAAKRVKHNLILVANQRLRVPQSPFISTVQVGEGPDVADSYIVENVDDGDLVITADLPLAAQVIENGAFALNPRGEFYEKNNIRNILSLRNFMEDLRMNGVETGGPAAYNNKDKEAFANALNRFLGKISP
ncbi:MAG: YaiI/YqxD family protein [Deferribacteres bacterium]|nr:YaiI/YqxD family protein [candidate division KSB1 bacterium]MCB9501645.1 YaiI/YqxD family protein [Deferribacteres bacterium]